MRGFDRAMTALALRAMPTKPPEHEKRLVPAFDDATREHLDRSALPHQRTAMIASLWPEPTRQCVVRPVFVQFSAPAILGLAFRFGAPSRVDARALQARLDAAFGAARPPVARETAKAA
ncbi:MAG: hypothetical protein J0L81_16615 [Caulobacterales bacterium]|nr:hypothetical protein [Caulobacterales bacterium]